MELTGKCKDDFEKWFLTKPDRVCNSGKLLFNAGIAVVRFDKLSQSMQWGVIQDFADSLEYNISVHTHQPFDVWLFEIDINKVRLFHPFKGFKTRQEARNAAIEKLNELVNEKGNN